MLKLESQSVKGRKWQVWGGLLRNSTWFYSAVFQVHSQCKGIDESYLETKKISKSATSCLGSTDYLNMVLWRLSSLLGLSVCKGGSASRWLNPWPFRPSPFLDSRGTYVAWVVSLSTIPRESHSNICSYYQLWSLHLYPWHLFISSLVNKQNP